ncbi:hypothetical protein [Methanosarcina vacuolata]|nr:hypothetical protein [Methanosarcina vacuolata]
MKQVDIVPRTSGQDRALVTRIFGAARAKNRHILGLELLTF